MRLARKPSIALRGFSGPPALKLFLILKLFNV
jgi:hypothetical protein